ncbi:hypothetical protein PVAP13_2KG375986 [Panicum virgatum]|uniref:Uncharacterized protein n=1 Tax=Panicum virgatum TaxID=38727 RepID=A0A8T0WBG9_PANVG|nr:hypothetical protein PVAP13_2KG375986 [Panicum virgatum]
MTGTKGATVNTAQDDGCRPALCAAAILAESATRGRWRTGHELQSSNPKSAAPPPLSHMPCHTSGPAGPSRPSSSPWPGSSRRLLSWPRAPIAPSRRHGRSREPRSGARQITKKQGCQEEDQEVIGR